MAAYDANNNTSAQSAASNSVTPTAPPVAGTPFVSDTMTGTDATLLTAHTGEVGATWTTHPSSTFSTGTFALRGGRVGANSSTSCMNLASGLPADVNYTVSADLYFVTVPTNQNVGISARVDPTANTQYTLRYIAATNLIRFDRITAGTTTTLGSVAYTPVAGATKCIRLRPAAAGGGMTASVDGVDIVNSTTDAAPLTSAGRVGVHGNNVSNLTTGVLLDNFVAAPLA